MDLEAALKDVPGTRSVYAERVTTGYFIDFVVRREAAARYGLGVEQVQNVVQSAIGGMNLTTTVEGRQRYPVNLRYGRELRNDVGKLKEVLVPVMPGQASGSSGMAARNTGHARKARLDSAFRAGGCEDHPRTHGDQE